MCLTSGNWRKKKKSIGKKSIAVKPSFVVSSFSAAHDNGSGQEKLKKRKSLFDSRVMPEQWQLSIGQMINL